ncbi:MAG: hypothetical protein V7637_3102, partial [Mycobacteriales bacterium]
MVTEPAQFTDIRYAVEAGGIA